MTTRGSAGRPVTKRRLPRGTTMPPCGRRAARRRAWRARLAAAYARWWRAWPSSCVRSGAWGGRGGLACGGALGRRLAGGRGALGRASCGRSRLAAGLRRAVALRVAVRLVARLAVDLRAVARLAVALRATRLTARFAVALRRNALGGRLARVVRRLAAALRVVLRLAVPPVTRRAALRISPSRRDTLFSSPASLFSSSLSGSALTSPCTAFKRSPPPVLARRRAVELTRFTVRLTALLAPPLLRLVLAISYGPPC